MCHKEETVEAARLAHRKTPIARRLSRQHVILQLVLEVTGRAHLAANGWRRVPLRLLRSAWIDCPIGAPGVECLESHARSHADAAVEQHLPEEAHELAKHVDRLEVVAREDDVEATHDERVQVGLVLFELRGDVALDEIDLAGKATPNHLLCLIHVAIVALAIDRILEIGPGLPLNDDR